MNIASTGSNALTQSIREMGELLKATTNADIDLDSKMMKVSVAEQVENSSLGKNLDVSA
jgi:hypothetical protein